MTFTKLFSARTTPASGKYTFRKVAVRYKTELRAQRTRMLSRYCSLLLVFPDLTKGRYHACLKI